MGKEKEIKMLIVEPEREPYVTIKRNELEAFQQTVGGWIQIVPMYPIGGARFGDTSKYLIICNEEGKLMGLQPNIRWGHDIICGPVAIVKNAGEEFDSIDEQDIEELKRIFSM